jgi:hypothetical protein
VLVSLRPGARRSAAAVLAALLTAAMGWFVGADGARSVVAALAVAALVLLLRTADPAETRWPQPPARRTRPGWHVVAGAQRAMEAARTDRDDRRSVQRRLDAVQAGGADRRIDAARAAVGLPATTARGRKDGDAPRATAATTTTSSEDGER